jgi:hypothetical protein
VRLVAMTIWLALTGCKIVHSTADDLDPEAATIGFAQSTLRVYQGDESARIVLAMSKPSNRPVSVLVRATGQSALEGADYEFPDRSITIPAGMETAYVPFSIVPDTSEESDETFLVELSDPEGVTLASAQAVVTISGHPRQFVSFETVSQEASEDSYGPVFLDLSQPSTIPVSVSYSLGGTASPTDYSIRAGTITFSPGMTRIPIPVGPREDGIDEGDETVILTLFDPYNADVGQNSTHTYTIHDNDPLPVAYIASGASVGEANTTVDLEVKLTRQSGMQVTVPFIVAGSTTATAGADYTLVTQSPLTFPSGTITALITINIADDAAIEGLEAIDIQLQSPTNAVLAGSETASVAITDND